VLEAPLTKQILKALKKKGGFWVKIHGGPFQVSGLPDIIGCYEGRFYGFEVKRDKSLKPTARQRLVLATIRRAGGISRVVTGPAEAIKAIRKTPRQASKNRGQNIIIHRQWLTASQSCAKIGFGLGKEKPISLWKLGRLVEKGEVSVRKYGRRIYYSSKSINSFLSRRAD